VTAPEVTGDPATPDASDRDGGSGWVRPVASWVLVVLASIGITASVLSLWMYRTVLDTDTFIETVTPAVESESVQAATSDYLSTELLTALDIQGRIEAALTAVDDRIGEGLAEALDLTPQQVERLQRLNLLDLTRLAAPIAAGLESRISDGITEFVSDPRTTERILGLARVAHERTVLLLRDELEQLPNLVVEDGQVKLNVVPLVAQAIRSLAQRGIEIFGLEGDLPEIPAAEDPTAAIQRLAAALGADLPPDFGQVQVMSEDRLRQLQDVTRMVDRLVWVLVIVTIILAVAAVLTAPTIRSGVIRVAIGGVIGLVLGVVLIQFGTGWLTDAAQSASAREALREVIATLTSGLWPIIVALVIVGVVAAGAALLSQRSPTSPADA
jgi:hypothetical protein